MTAIAALGDGQPTPIQREAIPLLLAGRDVLGQAATGTGKTAAFALPMLDRIVAGAPAARVGDSRGLVLVPTRELAMQVAGAIQKYAAGLRLSVVPVYGRASMDQQIRALRRGADIVVATPGRALDHLRRSTLKLDALRVLVLDEADEMLDMGFAEDLDAILTATPATRQTALFSATMPARIAAIAERHLKNPSRVTVLREKPIKGGRPLVRQAAYIVTRAQKAAVLARVLAFERPKAAIVFCKTRREVETVAEALNATGHRSVALHGGMEQRQRDQVMQMFRGGKADLLIATDVAARGLDIDQLSHVINYDAPAEPEAYLHRIGRTGRIGREGVAITLVDPRDRRLMRNIEAFTKQEINLMDVPTVADLHARQLDATRALLRERLMSSASRALSDRQGPAIRNEMWVVVDELLQEFEVRDIAAAAVAMIHEMGASNRMRIAALETPVVVERPRRLEHESRERVQPSRERVQPSRPRQWSLDPRQAPTLNRANG
jgi:ATP-dependent RNA helicase DeaD